MKTSLFSLLISICVAILSLFQFERYQTFTLNTRQDIQRIEKELSSKMTETHPPELTQFNDKIAALQQTVDELKKTSTASVSDLKTQSAAVEIEIESLVYRAKQQLQISHDIKTALSLLTEADTKVTALNNPKLASLHSALVEDIDALKAVQLPDYESMWLTIDGFLEDVPTLAVRTAPKTRVEQSNPSPEVQTTWKEGLKKSWDEIKDLVKIRHYQEQPIGPLLSTTEEVFAKERLQLLFEQIRFAILTLETKIYPALIKDTKRWISRYFDETDPRIQKMQTTLATYEQVALQPTLPSLESSIKQLKLLRQP